MATRQRSLLAPSGQIVAVPLDNAAPPNSRRPVPQQGPAGEDGRSIITGNGPPLPGVGKLGDVYIDALTGDLYQKDM